MAEQYIVEGNLKHDNAVYVTGQKVMLEDEDAKPLLAIGRVKLSAPPAPPDEQPAQQEPPAPAPAEPPQAPPAAPEDKPAPAPEQKPASANRQPTAEEIAKAVAQVS